MIPKEIRAILLSPGTKERKEKQTQKETESLNKQIIIKGTQASETVRFKSCQELPSDPVFQSKAFAQEKRKYMSAKWYGEKCM